MKFKFFILIFFVFSCSPHLKTLNQKKPYSATGFAYVYNNYDVKNKIILGKLDNDKLQISHQNLKTGTFIKIINPNNNKYIALLNVFPIYIFINSSLLNFLYFSLIFL